MSHILDALRQAEDERRLGQPPGRSAIASPLRAARRQQSPLLAWLILIAVMAGIIGGLAWATHPWWRTVFAPTPVETAAAPQQSVAASPSPEASVAQAPAPTPAQPPAEPAPPDTVEDAQAADAMPRAQLAEANRIDSFDALFEAPGPHSGEDAATSSADRPAPPPLQPTDIHRGSQPAATDSKQQAERPEARPSAAGDASASGREWADLPRASTVGMPEVSIDVHVYNDDPSRRFVLVDGRRRMEGDRLDNGAIIERISPDGLVLEWRGMRLARPLSR